MTTTIDDQVVIWSKPVDQLGTAPLILLLHGFGSSEADMAALEPHLPDGMVTAAVRAPLVVETGFAWVPIVIPGRPDPATLEASTEALLAWIDNTVPAGTTIGLVGFSQGGVMVSQLLRHRPEAFACGVILSGFIMDEPLPGDDKLAEVRPPVFFARGTKDQIIAPDAFDRSEVWLPRHTDYTERVYPGLTHQICMEELRDVSDFLVTHLR